jgi:hypothetical protein
LQRDGEHSGDYEKSANAHVRDAGPLRELVSRSWHCQNPSNATISAVPSSTAAHRSFNPEQAAGKVQNAVGGVKDTLKGE